jgi:hypothetical protein
MIHEVGVNLASYFGATGCPFPVVDGPELRPTTTYARERVVIEHDPAGDAFETRHTADKNPRTIMTRKTGVKITIYAQHASKGATYWEHVRRAEHVLDQVLCGLQQISKRRQNLFALRSGKFVFPEDLKASETPGGAVYELLFTFDRGVAERNWDMSIGPTAVISAVYPDTGPGVIIKNTDTVSGPDGSTENV